MTNKENKYQQLDLHLANSSVYLAIDPANSRLRLDGYAGDVQEIMSYLEELAKQYNASKVICYVRAEDIEDFLAYGYVMEALLSGTTKVCMLLY